MAFLGDISKKLSATSQTVVHKAKGIADITSLKSQISDEQKKIDKYYQSLGKLYYDEKKDEPLPELQELVALIRSSYYKIEEINKTIASIENTKTCPVCGKPLEDDMIFCVGCGAKIENPGSFSDKGVAQDSKFCVKCGTKIPKAAVFCVKCGEKQE